MSREHDADRRRRVAAAAVRTGLTKRIPGEHATRLLDLGVQDTPPGAAIAALIARCEGPVDLSGSVVAWTLRGAPHVVRRSDLGWWISALRPLDEEDLAARLYDYGSRLLRDGVSPLEGLAQTASAMRQVLRGRALSRSELSTEVTKLVDDPYRPYCIGCRVVHVQENLFRFGALQASAVVRSDGRTTTLQLADDEPEAVPTRARDELVRRFAILAEPADPAHLAGWLATSPAAANRLWAAAKAAAAARNRPEAHTVSGVRLLPASDPLLRLVDRALLTPDSDHRKELFRAVGGPGALLVDGNVSGTWRAKATGSRLAVSVHAWRSLTRRQQQRLLTEAKHLADARGVRSVSVD